MVYKNTEKIARLKGSCDMIDPNEKPEIIRFLMGEGIPSKEDIQELYDNLMSLDSDDEVIEQE